VRDIDLPIHHFGYLFNRDGVRDKFARYLALGYQKLRDNPESPLAYLELGKLVLCGGDAAEARDLFDQCVRLAPTLPNAVYYAALARFKLGHYDECRRMASDGLRARRDDLNLRYLLAMTDKRQERFADAATTLHQLAARRPEHFATHLHLAECCLGSGRLQQAQQALERCRELAPWQAAIYVLEAELAELQCEPWRIPAILDDGVAAAGPCRELLDYRKVFDALGQASG
jgi:cytochrome c-type biogenesis protein CcmH/NrfG